MVRRAVAVAVLLAGVASAVLATTPAAATRARGVGRLSVFALANRCFALRSLSGAKGVFINILNRFQTGSYFKTVRCPDGDQGVEVHTLGQSVLEALSSFFPAAKSIAGEPMPAYPSGLQCNARGLTPLGRYLIRRLMANHMSPTLAAKILAMARYRARGRFFGVGLGTDTNGFSSLPGPRPDAARHPLRYPFTSYDGSVTFTRERTGTRTFDLNRDGVAHYGLIADLIADMERTASGRRALPLLFNSAEAYLETWQRALAHGG